MPKFPEPPAAAELARIGPELRLLPKGSELWRLYFRGGPYPVLWDGFRAFGPLGSRFDHHLPPPSEQQRLILYAADHGPTCLAEVFQETRVIDRRTREPWLVGFELQHDLELLDLTGSWPTRAGASSALASGPRPRAQRWSRAIYEAFPSAQGLCYVSSMNAPRHAVALYERSLKALPGAPVFHRPLSDPSLLGALKQVAAQLGYGLL